MGIAHKISMAVYEQHILNRLEPERVFGPPKLTYSRDRQNAQLMWLKESGLISLRDVMERWIYDATHDPMNGDG